MKGDDSHRTGIGAPTLCREPAPEDQAYLSCNVCGDRFYNKRSWSVIGCRVCRSEGYIVCKKCKQEYGCTKDKNGIITCGIGDPGEQPFDDYYNVR